MTMRDNLSLKELLQIGGGNPLYEVSDEEMMERYKRGTTKFYKDHDSLKAFVIINNTKI